MIEHIDDYFSKGCGRCKRFSTPDCSVHLWARGLAELRNLCLEAGLREAVKWGHPCYMHNNRNIALFGAFKGNFRLTFLNASLLKDPEGVLERQGPNSQYPSMMRFTDSAEVAERAKIIRAYLSEAMSYADAGIRPTKVERDLPFPDELLEALDADPELAEAFHALTPGRQKSYLINLNSAKKPETRVSRIAHFRAKILAGKGSMDRF